MSTKNLLLEVYAAIGRARRLGQTTNLVRVATGHGDQRFKSGVLVAATKQQADQVVKDAWASGLPEVKCVSLHSLSRQSRGCDPVPLYFDNHAVGELTSLAASEIEKLESEVKQVRWDLQNMIRLEQIAAHQAEVLRDQLREHQDAVIRLSKVLRPPPVIVEGEDLGEAPRSPGSIAELLRELEQGGHLPLDSGKEGEEETP